MENKSQHLIKINLPGGVISAGDLYEILIIAEKAEAKHIRLGNRQQLYFTIAPEYLEDLENDMISAEISFELDADNYPNILSSYVTDSVFNYENWVKEGVYKDIFDDFSHKPTLKINVVDSNQTFAPFFTGNLNFISSDISNYWYLYIRFPKTNILYCWPTLVYSDDVAEISKAIEDTIFANKEIFYDQVKVNSAFLHKLVTSKGNFVMQPIVQPLKVPDFQLPYYEGFNRYGNKQWLGIYRRDELFAIDFLKDICALCMQTRVGQLYTTPWKSLLIKGIEHTDRDHWGIILNKYRINVRHAANELNWQIEDACDYCLDLKKQLVRDFEDADLRTYRLSFAIKKQPKTGLCGSIILKKQEGEFFEILHTKDFNPNSKDYIVYRQDIAKSDLSKHLIELCNWFYSQKSNITIASADEVEIDEPQTIATHEVHQCKNCLGIYDEVYGDDLNGIAPGTPFDSLEEYCCPTCDSSKEDFVTVNLAKAIPA